MAPPRPICLNVTRFIKFIIFLVDMAAVFFITSAIILVGLFIGSYTDIKTREVPDWLNYGLIVIGIALNLLFSIIYWNLDYIINSSAGFIVFLFLALFMFYAVQWGGGDSKMIMALGALIGLDVTFKKFPFLMAFLINILLVGAVYGLLWSIFLAFRNRKKFLSELKKSLDKKKIILIRRWLLILSLAAVVVALIVKDLAIRIPLLGLVLVIITTFYLWIFIKAIEKACMFKYVRPMQLTEGDWIAEDIVVGGKRICGPKDLGIEKKQINLLVKLYKQNKLKEILIKEGIPFVPSFLIAFIFSLVYGNLLFLFLS